MILSENKIGMEGREAMGECKKEMYFIGVSTQNSIINNIFPKWMEVLGYNIQLCGINIPLNASANIYQECAEKIKSSDNILGALVTTHKIAMYHSAKDIFDILSESAKEFKEIGAIYKREAGMYGEATDIISVNSAFQSIFDKVNISNSDICILGCGGAGVALGYVILKHYNLRINRIIMTDTNMARLSQASKVLSMYDLNYKLNLVHVNSIKDNNDIINSLKRRSFIINATGMGKDVQGAPISNEVDFPSGSCIWEYNYRGNLEFIDIAKEQAAEKQLMIYNGFEYFIYGWTTVISRVLNIDIKKSTFDKLANIALKEYI